MAQLPPLTPQEHGQDCLNALLFDLSAVRLSKLPPEVVQGWLQTVLLCLWKIRPVAARDWWLGIVADQTLREFPDYRGGLGRVKVDLQTSLQNILMLWQRWCVGHAPAAPVTAPSKK